MPEPDYLIREGDFGQTITATLLDANLAVATLLGGTVTFLMSPIQGGSPTLSAAGTVIDAGLGQVGYVWQDGDTDTAGLYLAEWQVSYLGGAVQTFPNDSYTLVRITPELP